MDGKFYNSPVLGCSVGFLISIVIDGVSVDLARFCLMKSISACFANVEDITCPRVDMNFIFERRTRYLTRSREVLLNTEDKIHIHAGISSTFAKHADILFIKQNLARSTITPSITIEIRNPTLHPKTGEL